MWTPGFPMINWSISTVYFSHILYLSLYFINGTNNNGQANCRREFGAIYAKMFQTLLLVRH